jgi:hypothetical protein
VANPKPNESDLLVRYSRRSLWLAAAVLALLGAYAVLINLVPDSAAAALAERMFMLLPLALAIVIAALRNALKGASVDPAAPGMKAVLGDELRQHSLNRACRNGFFAVLFAQPLLALVLGVSYLPYPAALMASATALVGVAVVLGSMLTYDR